MKTLIEIHALQNFVPSNLNRDDTGAPKDAWFGGTRRARISSQCVKRAIRQHFRDLLKQDDRAVRTKLLLDALTESLVQKGRDKIEANEKAKLALSDMGLVIKDDGKSEYLLFLGWQEIANFANIVNEKWDAITANEEASTKSRKSRNKKKRAPQNATTELKQSLDQIFNGGKAVDVALFGRMLTDMPEKNQDAACQVAHAISTHAVEREFDFYTALDDRKPQDTAGADMMGTVEFNSACFYRYAVIDLEKLLNNLQNDRELAKKGVRAFLEGFVVAEPTGKQNTFAAHNPPEFVVISVRRDTFPRNLANAFETAIRIKKDESLTQRSAEELVKKSKTLQAAFGGDGDTFVLNLAEAKLDGFGSPAESLEKLLNDTLSTITE